jgi:hypothetical protein
MSLGNLAAQGERTNRTVNAMKDKALRGLPVLLSLIIVFAAAGGQRAGLNLVIQQIRVIGPRQWLGLMAALAVANVPVIAPMTERFARHRRHLYRTIHQATLAQIIGANPCPESSM